MHILAVIDATRSEAPDGPATIVAGLSLRERNARLAEVCGADEIVIVDPRAASPTDLNYRSVSIPISVSSPTDEFTLNAPADAVLWLNVNTVYERSMVQQRVAALSSSSPEASHRSPNAQLALIRYPTAMSSIRYDTLQARIEKLTQQPLNGWLVDVDSPEAASNAAQKLWDSCRKEEDGLIARYLNRHISISMSRVLAPTPVTPDHVTGLTFVLGMAAALAAATGGYLGFLLAGVLYQLNSVIDGVDGELARVRYEFSFRGEWLDTISDDLADFLIYIGIGYGAWQTLPGAFGPFGNELWLVLGLSAAIAKLVSMAIYYKWLISHGTGDLLAFQWSFEEKPDDRKARLLSLTRYLFRKDFIVFSAMIASILGFLPYLLIALAPGNAIVAISVIIQQLRTRR